jgi:hypothetical protein
MHNWWLTVPRVFASLRPCHHHFLYGYLRKPAHLSSPRVLVRSSMSYISWLCHRGLHHHAPDYDVQINTHPHTSRNQGNFSYTGKSSLSLDSVCSPTNLVTGFVTLIFTLTCPKLVPLHALNLSNAFLHVHCDSLLTKQRGNASDLNPCIDAVVGYQLWIRDPVVWFQQDSYLLNDLSPSNIAMFHSPRQAT